MATLEEYARKRDVKGMILTALLTALSFVVGLFWNDAIRSGIETVIPFQERITAKFMAAFIVTILAVFAAYALITSSEIGGRISESAVKHLQKRIESLEKRTKKQTELIERQRKMIKEARKK